MIGDDERPRVRYQRRGRVAYVTIDRPAVLNALDSRTHAELAAAWDTVERDDEVWVAVLTGAGERAFSVGQDLKESSRRAAAGDWCSSIGSHGKPGWPRLTERFTLTKPVIARVNGYALGGGFELALACDLVIAAEHATFALPEARLGLIPGAGGVFRLTRQIPTRTAMGHLLTGRGMDARRAYQLGLINDVVPYQALDQRVDEWVSDILRCAPLSVRAIKQVAADSAHLSLADAFAAHYEWECRRAASHDAVEGMCAFVEKRAPNWTGGC